MSKPALFLFFALVGMGTEAFFTGIAPLIRKVFVADNDSSAFQFAGRVWVGMSLVYGFSAAPFMLIYSAIHEFHVLIRAPIYGAAIMLYELVAGLVIVLLARVFLGKTFYPWRYQERGHILYLTHLPYFQYWCLYGLILEYLYAKLIQ